MQISLNTRAQNVLPFGISMKTPKDSLKKPSRVILRNFPLIDSPLITQEAVARDVLRHSQTKREELPERVLFYAYEYPKGKPQRPVKSSFGPNEYRTYLHSLGSRQRQADTDLFNQLVPIQNTHADGYEKRRILYRIRQSFPLPIYESYLDDLAHRRAVERVALLESIENRQTSAAQRAASSKHRLSSTHITQN